MNDQLFKIIGFLLIVTACCVLIRAYRPDFAFTVCIAAGAGVLIFILKTVSPAIESIRNSVSQVKSASVYFKVALKALGIAYITGFAADICRDFGQSSLASKAEFAGKCAVFVLSVPLVTSILDAVTEFAKI